MNCPRCSSVKTSQLAEKTSLGYRIFLCSQCGRKFNERTGSPFNFLEFPTDIVTLDRVICCYHDMQALVGLSVAKAGRLYGLVYPRDTWWMRAAISVGNLYFRVIRNPFRTFIHPTQVVDALVRSTGFQQCFYKTSGPWQVVIYAR